MEESYSREWDAQSGNTLGWVDLETGEYLPNVKYDAPEGSEVISPREAARRKEYGKMMRQREAERQEDDERRQRRHLTRKQQGQHYFLASDVRYQDVSPATAARLVYLATFMGYDNRLYLTERTPMRKSDLGRVLGLSAASVCRFWSEIDGKYLTADRDKTLIASPAFFSRGRTPQEWFSREFQFVYIDVVRELYRRTPRSRDGKLGYVFQMLPFVSVEFNALCWNPHETDISMVEFLTVRDFCAQIGYDQSQCSRLFRDYTEIKFEVDGEPEKFCAFVFTSKDVAEAKVFINPRVLYKGSQAERVQILGAFCKPG